MSEDKNFTRLKATKEEDHLQLGAWTFIDQLGLENLRDRTCRYEEREDINHPCVIRYGNDRK